MSVNDPLVEKIRLPESRFLQSGREFNTLAELLQWADENISNIEQDPCGVVRQGNANVWWHGLATPFRQLKKIIEEFVEVKNPTKKQTGDLLKSIHAVNERIASGASFSQQSELDRLIRDSGRNGWFWLGFHNLVFNWDIYEDGFANNEGWIRNTNNANELLQGEALARISGFAGQVKKPSTRVALEGLEAEMRRQLDVIGSDLEKTRAELEEFESNRLSKTQATDRRIFSRIKEAMRSHSQMLAEHDAKMLALQNAFKDEMNLRAPATYWKTRGDNARNVAIIWGVAFLFLISAAVLLTLFGGEAYLTAISSFATAAHGSESNFGIVTQFALISIPAGILFWLFRIPARLIRQNVHLMNDARHREMLVKTYLALVYENAEKFEPDERSVLMANLFCPPSELREEEGNNSIFGIPRG